MRLAGSGSPLLLAAFVAFLLSNLIHNRFRLDAAVLPAAIAVGLQFWRPRRTFHTAAAILIALPALAFFKWPAFLEPAHLERFLNHLFLLLAGVLACASGVAGLVPSRSSPRPGAGAGPTPPQAPGGPAR